jgi:hypothetical protein
MLEVRRIFLTVSHLQQPTRYGPRFTGKVHPITGHQGSRGGEEV